jgi:hypothetical protein
VTTTIRFAAAVADGATGWRHHKGLLLFNIVPPEGSTDLLTSSLENLYERRCPVEAVFWDWRDPTAESSMGRT